MVGDSRARHRVHISFFPSAFFLLPFLFFFLHHTSLISCTPVACVSPALHLRYNCITSIAAAKMFIIRLLQALWAIFLAIFVTPVILILSAFNTAMPGIEEILLQLKASFREDCPVEIKIRLIEQAKTYVKANNLSSRSIRLAFSAVRCVIACNNYVLIEKGYKLFRYILSRLSLQGYAHISATQGMLLFIV